MNGPQYMRFVFCFHFPHIHYFFYKNQCLDVLIFHTHPILNMFLFCSYFIIFFSFPYWFYWCRGVIQFTHLTMYLNVWSFSKKIQSLATKHLTRLFSSRSFVLNVYHLTKVSCISGHLFKNTIRGLFWTPIYHLSNLFVVSFDVIIINYKSNLLWKNCIDVTFHVVFVTFCHDI